MAGRLPPGILRFSQRYKNSLEDTKMGRVTDLTVLVITLGEEWPEGCAEPAYD